MRLIDADLLEKKLIELAGDNPPMFYYFSKAIGVIRKQLTVDISKMERTTEKHMSGDLIRRKIVDDLICKLIESLESKGLSMSYDMDEIINLQIDVENIPIAYDVDKVVDKIESFPVLDVTHPILHGKYLKKSTVINIVKGGGIDE